MEDLPERRAPIRRTRGFSFCALIIGQVSPRVLCPRLCVMPKLGERLPDTAWGEDCGIHTVITLNYDMNQTQDCQKPTRRKKKGGEPEPGVSHPRGSRCRSLETPHAAYLRPLKQPRLFSTKRPRRGACSGRTDCSLTSSGTLVQSCSSCGTGPPLATV